MKSTARVFAAFLFLLAALFYTDSSVFAQQQGAGIKLIPATIEDGAQPGETVEERVTVTNISDEEKVFYLYTREIKGVQESGAPIFTEPGAEVTGFEITEWITLAETELVLSPGQVIDVPVTIAVPDDASPGSHFGGIFVSVEPPRLREIGAGVGYEVASIVSIRVAGDVIDDARIRSLSTDRFVYGEKDVEFLARVENQGNILIRPRGPMTITNMYGQEVAAITVNDSLAGVFPNTTRDFTIEWNDESLGFGKYEAVLALVYEGDRGQNTIDATVSFWVLPTNIIVPILIGVLVLGVLIYILTRVYVNRAIAQAGGGRRIAPQRYRRQVGVSRLTFVIVSVLSVSVLFLIILLVLLA